MLRIVTLLFFTLNAFSVAAQTLSTSAGGIELTKMVSGLDTPWAVGVLPDGAFLITERDGDLLFVQNGKATTVRGVPKVAARGQGGLLDVTVPRDFRQSREVFLSFSKPQNGGAGTAIAVGRLSENGKRLTNVRVIYEATPGGSGGRHFGSRIVEAQDGTFFVTIGDRGQPDNAQDRSSPMGSVIRINRNGSIPVDNPFVGQSNIKPEIWSFGHRNPQGAALDAQGRLWVSEHGARGGDEINQPRAGRNYGWPVISYGTHYSGQKIGEGTSKAGMEQPELYWDPSIAPSGLLVYSGKLWPQWKGNIFVGSLKFDYIARLAGKSLREVEQIKGPETERVRDIVEAPDGSIWFISVGQGAVYRMTPQG
ncbi:MULTISPECIES: PQQ-dependent sugar dehydrogenase [unclassified Ruegeria]|uniref:PQQ-dependent sugar dehydrogenase n=1 Tax=unclassified Ruegeria TaxID=2625375 RepID=UPI001489C707|nr:MULTISPECIES: PQQ-dependent sugar dehydrogenase [unclassified Ruegeria]NOD33451.1 PQQ-dependent sugar dehydrogenase [Ruegeria sp. HKCCD7296]NOD46233.1 PQQ-dependent sugar dehydrogenase [Ruegeria sp. HKCCD5849]NOD50467.1 PQQ-dependent sugar dehydrogenase [Ruegeria sp. HKCCD5851]NOD67283.1 PQQ-dependent sugar dehydrogenase [Ruegeria sp. HKCCD7303]NOE32871.1 PQQ-dependent sugar dehydrogenase [Ruegeria sp. HKCCD7318]